MTHSPEQLTGGHGAIRTLLGEDDPGVRVLLETVLTLRGHGVEAYGDGEQAWQAFERGGFSLIVLDWMLPGLDGLEICRRIRATPGGEMPVVLAITARDDRGTCARCSRPERTTTSRSHSR